MKSFPAWSLVVLQFILIGLLVVLPAGNLWAQGAFLAVVAGGLVTVGIALAYLGARRLGKTLTPSPIPRQGGELHTSGIYASVRHPIYTGLLTAALGLALWGGSTAHLIALAALVGLIAVKARAEEKMLLVTYSDYASYASQVGRFVPGIGKLKGGA